MRQELLIKKEKLRSPSVYRIKEDLSASSFGCLNSKKSRIGLHGNIVSTQETRVQARIIESTDTSVH